MSTENLLLNGYRALQFGVPLQILVDCEYSNTTYDGFATMLIGVMSLDNVFHILSYAILNHEDEIGQLHALRATREQIELVAKKYNCGKI
jgi:hypothetical protein